MPYATVIDIDAAKLPTAETVNGWSANEFVGALRHDPANPAFNASLRQLVHVGFKVAAQIGRHSYPPAWGKNKKDAEQRAALNALSQIAGDPLPFVAE